MEKLVVLSGAGISAESGISTFRDANGLWEGHDIIKVASPEGFERNPNLVMEFYNKRRAQLNDVEPNTAHTALAYLEYDFDVQIITQNVDDLHERAGSTNVLHLHGELRKVRPVNSLEKIVWKGDLNVGDVDENGVQLRPDVVWFGEDVPNFTKAIEITKQADVFVVVGTSMQVNPAASLIDFVPRGNPIYIVDPNEVQVHMSKYMQHIKATATEGMATLVKLLS